MPLPQTSKVIKIFFSYKANVRRDKNILDELKTHMMALRQQKGDVQAYFDSDIYAGSNWQEFLDTCMNDADIIVLLINPDFLASEQCFAEMKRALERCEAGLTHVLSVLLSPTLWIAPSDKVQFLPPDRRPISLRSNKSAALYEVAKGIRKVVEEISQFARLSYHSKRSIPYRQNPFFTGRQALLTTLHNRFDSAQPLRTGVEALSGPGGIGKTQLAVEYIYRYKHEYKDVFWIKAESYDLFRTEITALANTLALPLQDYTDEAYRFDAIKQWLEQRDKWFLVLDNLEDFTLVDAIIPVESGGHVLITTRSQATGSLAQTLTVGQMTIEESTLFLLHRAKKITAQRSATAQEHVQAKQIAQEMDGFPLALDQAGAYVEETNKSFADYLALYRKHRLELLDQRGQFPNGHPDSLKATLFLTFDKVARVHPGAMKLLYLLAFLHPDAIPEELIADGASELPGALHMLAGNPFAFDKALRALLRYSLVHRHADTTTLSMHRIVQAILREKLSPALQQQWITTVVRLIDYTLSTVDLDNLPLCQRYVPQAQLCATYIISWHLTSSAAEHVLYHLGYLCYKQALYTDAETYLTQALTICELDGENMQEERAACLNILALLYRTKCQFERAEDFQQRALALYEQLWGPDHLETASILNNLGLLYFSWNKTSLAESLYLRALSTYNRYTDKNVIEQADILNNLGLLYHDKGKYTQAESFYRRGLALREILLNPLHPDIAQSMNNLAALYKDQGKFQQARSFLEKALELREQTFGPQHPETGVSLHNLAMLYHDQGQDYQAETLLTRALEIFEQTLGPEHPQTAMCLNSLALMYQSQKQYQQAEALYRRAIAIYEHRFGPLHTDVAFVFNNLGRLYFLQKDYQQAEPLLQQAVAIREEELGPLHPDTAISLANLAELYTWQDQLQQAEPLYQRALSIYQQTFSDSHPRNALIMDKYAFLLEKAQRIEEAMTLREAARRIKERHR